MKEFERSEEYQAKIFLDAFDANVVLDAKVDIVRQGSKLKAYCPYTRTYLQFPRALRKPGAKFIADVIQAKKTSGTIFYRAYKGSIRNAVTGEILG